MDIKTAKKFFWIAFAISAIFFIISALICMAGYEHFSNMAMNIYHIEDEDFNSLVLCSMSVWKILIFQFTLVPALVLTIMDRKNKQM